MASLAGSLVRVFMLRTVVLSALLLLLASCTQPTVFPRYLTVADVINNIKCELQMAIGNTRDRTWLNRWTAAFTVTLQVERRTGASGDLTLVVPYVNPAPGLFTLVVGGGLSKSGQARMSFVFNAENNLGLFMAKDRCDYTRELRSRNNLAGETGLQVWFESVIDGINRARITKQTTGFSYNLEFITTLDGHIRPSFRTVYPSGRIFSGAFDLNHNRQDKNTLNVAFAPPAESFAKTALGKALARIEAELHDARGKEKTARDERNGARKPLTSENPALSTLSTTKIQELKNALETKEVNLENATAKVRALEIEQATVAGAAAGAVAATGPAISTQQQLNNLVTLDAIRDIPR